MSHNVPGAFSVAGTVALDSKLILQDDHIYSTVDDDTQGQMFIVSSNLAYGTITEPSNQPVPQVDHTYSSVDNSQQETVVTSGNPAYATSLRPEASASDNPAYSNTSRSVLLITQYLNIHKGANLSLFLHRFSGLGNVSDTTSDYY